MTNRTIDIHTHILTEEMLRLLGKEGLELAPKLKHIDSDNAILEIGGLTQDPYYRGGWDIDRRLEDMNANGVNMQLLSPGVQTFFYNREPKLARALARLQNEQIASFCLKYPKRFMGLASVPLQDPAAAAEELEYAIRVLNLRGAQIGSHVEGRNLDDPGVEQFWAKAAALKAFILIHPHQPAAADRLRSYYFRNFIGLTLETTIAACSLVFGGLIERYPDLRICLCHAGGFVPYQSGRFDHGWNVRPEAKVKLQGTPHESFKRLFYDTITHARGPLEFLINEMTSGQVLLGSDYPFDMGNMNCVSSVNQTSLEDRDRAAILGETAAALLAAPVEQLINQG